MPLDFSKLGSGSKADTAVDPRTIFSALPNKDSRYGYLRDVQAEVLVQWHSRRTEPDLVIKMNTGGGKTVVGLLALKSSINEGIGPALYVVPDSYLVEQVVSEASALGIRTTDDPRSRHYLGSTAVAVVSVSKLVNGRSVFGTAATGESLPIGTLLVDDAHSCLKIIEQQFTLVVTRKAEPGAYKRLLSLFQEDLRHQSSTGVLDIESEDPRALVEVPYWSWADKQDDAIAILHPLRAHDDFMFKWALLQDYLPLCQCVFTSSQIEIKPPCIPIEAIPSIRNGQRRLYLTATLADDSVLIADFHADAVSVQMPITPTKADDIGDRMIVAPQELNPNLDYSEVQTYVSRLSADHNVVVISPSTAKAARWKAIAKRTLYVDDLHDAVEQLKTSHVGLVVMVNKYDGVDLPDSACRVLVIDGLPEAFTGMERLAFAALSQSVVGLGRQIQRIEQGMGRGVRSYDDYCVVILLGEKLTQSLHLPGASAQFSAATLAQLALSRDVAMQLDEPTLDELDEVIQLCLQRNSDWRTAARNALVGVEYSTEGNVPPAAVAMRQAFDHAVANQFRRAAGSLQDAINSTVDKRHRAWLKQYMAAYTHRFDPVSAQQIQLAAVSDNAALLKPLEGMTYIRLSPRAERQGVVASNFLQRQYATGNDLIIAVNAILSDLGFRVETTRAFERAVASLAAHLGFEAQQPDADTGKGPDVLWALGDQKYAVIECKSGVTTNFIAKKDADQLSGSMNWFADQYGEGCSAVPIMVHKVSLFHKQAVPHPGTRIITEKKLSELGQAFRRFAVAIANNDQYMTPASVTHHLDAQSLSHVSIFDHFTDVARRDR